MDSNEQSVWAASLGVPLGNGVLPSPFLPDPSEGHPLIGLSSPSPLGGGWFSKKSHCVSGLWLYLVLVFSLKFNSPCFVLRFFLL